MGQPPPAVIGPDSRGINPNAAVLARPCLQRPSDFVRHRVHRPSGAGARDDRAGEELYRVYRSPAGHSRIAIAPVEELKISRRLAWLEETSTGRLLVRNLSTHVSLGIEGGTLIKPGAECETELPVVLKCASIVVRIQTAEKDDVGHAIQSLDQPLEPPSIEPVGASRFKTLDLQVLSALDVEEVIGWLRTMIEVLHSAAGDTGFFQRAAQAAVEVVSLDRGRVLTARRRGLEIDRIISGVR